MPKIVKKELSDKLEEALKFFQERNAISNRDMFILVSEYADRIALDHIGY
jgi:hypothetical protein